MKSTLAYLWGLLPFPFTNGHPPDYWKCPCFTATVTVSGTDCKPLTSMCIEPMCAKLETTTIPGPNPHCPTTATVTSTTCKTACATGCAGTFTTTVTATDPCFTAGPGGPPTTIPPTQPTTCYTWTSMPSAPYCPDVGPCTELACLVMLTSTLPPIDPNCPVTPIITATPSCLPSCKTPAQCATTWTTIHGSPTATGVVASATNTGN